MREPSPLDHPTRVALAWRGLAMAGWGVVGLAGGWLASRGHAGWGLVLSLGAFGWVVRLMILNLRAGWLRLWWPDSSDR